MSLIKEINLFILIFFLTINFLFDFKLIQQIIDKEKNIYFSIYFFYTKIFII